MVFNLCLGGQHGGLVNLQGLSSSNYPTYLSNNISNNSFSAGNTQASGLSAGQMFNQYSVATGIYSCDYILAVVSKSSFFFFIGKSKSSKDNIVGLTGMLIYI